MTSRDHLPAELRRRATERLDAGQSQTEVEKWLNESSSVVQRLWKQLQARDSASKRFSQGRPTATARADNRYLTLCARGNKTATQI